tara:strand:+ start:4375 stop:4920 length:546 start_codon:yes stop_codon:yes gene_type:complete
MPVIYISRRCKNCQELIILLHSNKELTGKFNVIDIDNNTYPSYLQVVPTMVVDETIVFGEELFKYINIALDKITKRVTPPLENSTKPEPSDNFTVDQKSKEQENSEDLPGYCIDGICALDFSSLEEDTLFNNRDVFEKIDEESDTNSGTDLENLPSDNKDKSNKLTNDYEQLIQDRNKQLV